MINDCEVQLQSPIPRVSWLLCTHREDALLHRAVESCLGQTLKDFELLLVVNGPEVENLFLKLSEVYASDARIRIIRTDVHLLNFSLSLGLHLARSPFVARMDADDISHPYRLERQLSYMQAHPDVVVLGSNCDLINENSEVVGHTTNPSDDQDIRRSLRYRNPICHPTVMFRREAILAMGGYLGGKHAEDYDLWVRMANNTSWRFANLPESLLSYNASPAGQARRSRAAYANVAVAQWREFLITRDPRWLMGAVITAAKSFVLTKQA